MSLPASLLQKINVTMNRLCQMVLKQKLLHEFKKSCKFSGVKAKSHATKSRKTSVTAIPVHGSESRTFTKDIKT
jgi:hypothetical protein